MRPFQELRIARMVSKTVSFKTPYKVFKENRKYPRLSKWVWNLAVRLGILEPYIDQETIRVEHIDSQMQKRVLDNALTHIENAIDNGAKRDRLCLVMGMDDFDELLSTDFTLSTNAFQFMGQFGYSDDPEPTQNPYTGRYEYRRGRLHGIPVQVYPWIKGMAVIEV